MAPKSGTWPEAIATLAGDETVARALKAAEQEADWITERHIEFTRIAAPTFGEQPRADYFFRQFTGLKLDRVRRDEAGNVLAEWAGVSPQRQRRVVAISAHLDTVFAPERRVELQRQNGRIYGPGITDNGAGLAALLGLARIVRRTGVRTLDQLLFVANVAEEGEGNLYGMRHLLQSEDVRQKMRYMLVLDGANIDHITAHGLGSRRYLATITGPGGHSWSDFGMANPIHALAAAITAFAASPVPAQPRTTFNIGQVQGGTSINSIPFSAAIKVDIRSGSAAEIRRLSALLEKAVRQAVEAENTRATSGKLAFELQEIGERPAADLPENARILETVRAVDRYLGIRSRVERSSTDANIPLSLGIEAVSLGGGGQGGAAHSPNEWYDPTGRALGLKRLLLSIVALAGLAD